MNGRIFKWVKLIATGAHYFKYDGNKYRLTPGDTIICTIAPIKPFIDHYECMGEIIDGDLVKVDGDVLQESIPGKDDITLEVVAKGDGYYDVINPNNPDKPINENSLRITAAYTLAGLPVPVKRTRRRK